ncbi:MAG: hypothetical protein PHR06_16435 [Candidatus Cloacimonetes bacterium]|nr:hypothetical protein [Candidatus Cloacimonadota bacterium]
MKDCDANSYRQRNDLNNISRRYDQRYINRSNQKTKSDVNSSLYDDWRQPENGSSNSESSLN